MPNTVSVGALSPSPPLIQPQRRVKGAALLALIGTAVVMVAPHTTGFEGTKNKPYLDPVGIRTVCNGETENVEDRIYSNSECATMLRKRMAQDYAPKIIACVPDFADPARLSAFSWSIDAAYNTGPRAFCKSPMAAKFNHGDWSGGCKAFKGWYVTGTAKQPVKGAVSCTRSFDGKYHCVLPGLVARRDAEAKGCAG